MLDNYDSFTYNLVQYLGELGAEVTTLRNDEVSVEDILQTYRPDGIVVSPGPCTPSEARQSPLRCWVSAWVISRLARPLGPRSFVPKPSCTARRPPFGTRVRASLKA
jgi:hypothetical protein